MKRHRLEIWAIVVLLVAAWLRFHALARDARFHPDEALFATFARNAAVQGDWLLHGPLDKTPLTIYAGALSMASWGVTYLPDGVLTLDVHAGEFAARVPNVFASIMLVAVTGALARRLYRHERVRARNAAPILAAALVALSPFAVAFSATAFTDGLMLVFVLLSLWMAAARRPLSAGIWLAVGFACKQQALLVLPLLALVGWGQGWMRRRAALCLLLPLAVVVALLLLWDAARGQPVSLWALAAANNDPGRLDRFDEALPRLLRWAGYAQWFAGSGWLTAALGAAALLSLTARLVRQPRTPAGRTDLVLAAYVLGYFVLHWLGAINIYDRYLLPVLPVALVLAGRGIAWVLDRLPRPVPLPVVLIAAGCLGIAPALDAANGRIAIGGDLGKHEGIDRLAAYLNQKPLGAIIYDRWLGWELGYYVGAWSDKRRVYYPTPAALAAGALAQPDPAPRYFPVPASQPVTPWLDALRAAGFTVSSVYDNGQFRVYELRAYP